MFFFYYIIVWIHTNAIFCSGGNHFVFEGQRKVILLEKHETYIYQLQIMYKPEIVFFFKFELYIERYLTDYHLAHPNVKNNKCKTNYTLKCRAKFNVSDVSPG